MAFFHHGSVRKYTAALLDFFNNVEIQYKISDGNPVTKSVPIRYTSREKSRIFEDYAIDQMLGGNYNFLPRGNLALSGITKAEARTTNKNLKIGTYASDTSMEFMHNSVPYEFAFDVSFQCRGMNEATQIVEQIAPKFNPTVNLDVWDAQNLDEPSRIAVKLNDIQIEQE